MTKDILGIFKTFRLEVTYKNGKRVSQNVRAFDTAEAMILFASRPHIQIGVTDEDGEPVGELIKIEFVPVI